MKKILTLISNHGDNQYEYCENLIRGLQSIKKYSFDIKVCSSAPHINFENCENICITHLFNHEFPKSIYEYLHNNDFTQYDYIFFTENDILYTEENFDTYFNYETNLNDPNKTIGFLRYEINNDGVKYFVDMENSVKNVIETTENNFVRLINCHQGSWLLRSTQLSNIINNIIIRNELEDIASNYYFSETWPGTHSEFAIKKYIPMNDYQKLLVHHQSNKYFRTSLSITIDGFNINI